MKKLFLSLFVLVILAGCSLNDPNITVDPSFTPSGKVYSRFILQSVSLTGQISTYLFYIYTFTSTTEVVRTSISIPNQPVDSNPQYLTYELINPDITFKNSNGDITDRGKFKSEKALYIGTDCYNLK